uniref:Uncharacterized protein n=1 Tax=Sphaerodactylus townsendi TaxID=933632 RepID=A0ACB8G987_9SAUR
MQTSRPGAVCLGSFDFAVGREKANIDFGCLQSVGRCSVRIPHPISCADLPPRRTAYGGIFPHSLVTTHGSPFVFPLSAVRDLIFWRDVKKTGLVFSTTLILLLSLAAFSVISVVSYLILALLSVTISFRVYKSVIQAVQKSEEGHPFKAYLDRDITLSSETFHNYMSAAMVHINHGLKLVTRLFLVEDLVDSLKLAVVMWLMTYVGAIFNGITLLILAELLGFSMPVVYEKYKTQIDHYVGIGRDQIKTVVTKLERGGGRKRPVFRTDFAAPAIPCGQSAPRASHSDASFALYSSCHLQVGEVPNRHEQSVGGGPHVRKHGRYRRLDYHADACRLFARLLRSKSLGGSILLEQPMPAVACPRSAALQAGKGCVVPTVCTGVEALDSSASG